MFQGTFIFPDAPYYGWYIGVGAIFLNTSWSLHNVIAWIKVKPFLSRRVSLIYIITVALAQPYWVLEITANFLFFNQIGPNSDLFIHTRPYEALFRDPWWIFTTIVLFYNIKERYEFGVLEIFREFPRFAILILAMILSIIFIIVDILAVTHVVAGSGLPDGLNPFWKFAFIFKCLTDTLVLDDFKTALDRLQKYKMEKIGNSLYPGNTNHLGNTWAKYDEVSTDKSTGLSKTRAQAMASPVIEPQRAYYGSHDDINMNIFQPEQGKDLRFVTVPDDSLYRQSTIDGRPPV